MDIDLEHADRSARALLIIELVAVCQLHGAQASLDLHDGICVSLARGPLRLEWWWHWAASAGCLEVGCAKSPVSYPAASPAQWGEALQTFGRLLADDAFHAALAVCLTRIRPLQAAALRRHHQRARAQHD